MTKNQRQNSPPKRVLAAPKRDFSKSAKKGAPKTAKVKTKQNSPKGRQLVRKLCYWSAVCSVWSIITGVIVLLLVAADLPDLETPPEPGTATPALSIRTVAGAEIISSGPLYGDQLSFNEIPDVLIQAFLAIEDRNFFSHLGVDPKGIARAALGNLRANRISGGGSTITQQLAKNMFLSFEKTWSRKGQEVLLAFWLEQKYSKEEILALYLNRIYFGGGAYGIDAAAKRYFGHSAFSLSLTEAALLAGIVKAPGRYAPHLNPEMAWERAKIVLKAMEDVGLLTSVARISLSQTPPDLVDDTGNRYMGYFVDYVRQEVRRKVDHTKDLIVYTTLDPSLQRAAYTSLSSHLDAQTGDQIASQAALISLDTEGAVKALIGGRDYQKSQFNRVTEALRQPGSAFKLFPYLAALERGASPEDIELDTAFSIDGWAPSNYSGTFNGRMKLEEAFARSINTVAVTIAERAGRHTVAALAKRLGITTPVDPIASLPLGTEEVKLIDLTAAYSAVANGGFKVEPYTILEIREKDGTLLYRKIPEPKKAVLNYEVVEDITRMLASVITDGSGKNARIDRPAGGKSGTTQSNRDAVFIGFTADYVTAVWTGNDDYSPMKGVTGSGLPAKIWRDYNLAAHVAHQPRPLLADAGLYTASNEEANGTKTDQRNEKKGIKRSLFDRIFGRNKK